MSVDVLAKVVDLGLLHITQVTNTEGEWCRVSGEGDVDSQHLAPLRSRDECRGYDVMVVVAPRENLVVRLPIVRREHDAC